MRRSLDGARHDTRRALAAAEIDRSSSTGAKSRESVHTIAIVIIEAYLIQLDISQPAADLLPLSKGRSNLPNATARVRSPALESLRVRTIIGRARARLSQSELALRACVSRPTISRIERGVGDAGIDVIQRIADVLGVTVADLVAPLHTGPIETAELERRFNAPVSEFVDADALLEALSEAEIAGSERYSRAGRPSVAR